MTKTMLIDATSAEETRVAVVDGPRLEEFDYESAARRALKGNIYLAKVTRVEPSLQACFVEYGGNRHGFLLFGDIHPDYFRIPVADREAFEAAQREALERAAAAEAQAEAADTSDDPEDEDGAADATSEDADEAEEGQGDQNGDEGDEEARDESQAEETEEAEDAKSATRRDRGGRGGRRGRYPPRVAARTRNVETLGGDHAYEEELAFRFDLRRQYKIQEVIHRGQIMLVQAQREERGNKGAAVTTYLSLPGRYCVLMPNSPRGGGVSRKVATHADRARMRDMLREMAVPQGMSVILRTAGMSRTKAEIKRDLDYLLRLWDELRATTLASTAPALIYEEGSLIKRAVRDLYTRDIEEIIVAGAEGYKTAREVMKMMIPSHLRRVKEHTGEVPLFTDRGIEGRIAAMTEPEVPLKSGGSIVINPTEALVAIDVNSGRATKGRHIEETALKTNLEAADEVARQLRLRDLGGLIVIDFIDMDQRGNNAKVERRLKDALSGDRARIQVGRISSFGLMEMSRQRMNPSLSEVQFDPCPACGGTGRVRSADASGLVALRDIEAAALKYGAGAQVTIRAALDLALYLLNTKRTAIGGLETRYGITVRVEVDRALAPSVFAVQANGEQANREQGTAPPARDSRHQEEDPEAGPEEEEADRDNQRRGRRGGRSRRREGDEESRGHDRAEGEAQEDAQEDTQEDAQESGAGQGDDSPAEPEQDATPAPAPKPAPKSTPKPASKPAPVGPSSNVTYEVVSASPPEKKKRGWWNRLID
jgi:ribonuclease E